ncbi:MAG: thiamine phosphate synthase, partial [Candidatus Acidiferrum sp.]
PAPSPPLELPESLDLSELSGDEMRSARLLDASANRAREGLRVVEDYCRFVLDDAILCGEAKSLRHELAATLALLPSRLLLSARDTSGDVGRNLSTEAELARESLIAVVRANIKRLQEALRSLEEFGKIYGQEVGRGIEAIRYRTYILEKALDRGEPARHQLRDARLYLIVTASQCLGSLDRTVDEAVAGGVDLIQLREKEITDRALLAKARHLREITRHLGVPLVINDRPDVANAVDADGVHLGQDDMTIRDARHILGRARMIGVSTHNLEQVRQAVLDGADYIGVGPAYPSATKQFAELAGLPFVREACAVTSLPSFVIGGVNSLNIREVVEAGGCRVAVSQAILRSENPRAVAIELRRLLTGR